MARQAMDAHLLPEMHYYVPYKRLSDDSKDFRKAKENYCLSVSGRAGFRCNPLVQSEFFHPY
jgi:hypothetical protein